MAIGVWDYLGEYAEERECILDAVDRVFGSGRLILGSSVSGFEREFAQYHGVPYCIGVDNGTNALKLALRALDVGPGDEVITVANTAPPTAVAIQDIGAIPVFVDINTDDYLMDPARVAEVISPRTKAVLPVHLYGQCVEMAPIRKLADEYGLVLVEDCAQAHGARHNGALAGTMSDAAAFSFYPTKVLGAYGDGGAVLTCHDSVDERVRRLRYYGMRTPNYVEEVPGYNSRLDEVQAEILRHKLLRLDTYIAGREGVAQRYRRALSGQGANNGLIVPKTSPGNEHVYYQYVVRHPERDTILEKLADHGVKLSVNYPWPLHTMSGFAHLGYQEGDLPVTEAAAREIFSLPMYPSLSEYDQERVIRALGSVLSDLS